MSNKAIPSVAGEMVERARKGGLSVSETLMAGPWGLVGHVDIKVPGELREFLTIYIGEPAIGSKRRRVSYVESSGQLTQRLADRALRTVLRQLKRDAAQARIDTAELVRRSQEWMPVVSRKRVAELQRVGRVLRPENRL